MSTKHCYRYVMQGFMQVSRASNGTSTVVANVIAGCMPDVVRLNKDVNKITSSMVVQQ